MARYCAKTKWVTIRTGSRDAPPGRLYILLDDHSLVARDRLGSTAITTDSSGVKTGEIRYYPWGTERYTYGSTPTNYHFTGQRLESVTGSQPNGYCD